MSPRGCLVDLVNFLNSLAKEMPFLLSSRDAYGKKELSIGIKLKLASSITEQYSRNGPVSSLSMTEGLPSQGCLTTEENTLLFPQ